MGALDKIVPLDRLQEQTTRVASRLDDTLSSDTAAYRIDSDPAVYKVYKKRWIGVAIIVLLNIVFSWGYGSMQFI